ncbi:MAG TPA: hypothetical protein VLZ77_02415 [Acidimicrobiales bacterium]|nr:hypothetical protein [Acidimicrobiales bacterium]
MRTPRSATWAARTFALVVLVGCAALGLSANRPWLTINGVTYTFFNADGWKALPLAELVVAAGGAVATLIAVRQVKRIGLAIGFAALLVNVVGAVVAARLANIHNADQYFRTSADLTMRPAWAGWMALATCAVLLVGASSRWSAQGPRTGQAARLPERVSFEGSAGQQTYVSLQDLYHSEEPTAGRTGLPTLDDVLAPPRRGGR